MFIFYDFETSSRSTLGQILSYSFRLVDETYQTQSRLSGQIRLSRIQLPEVGAILINRIDVDRLQKEGDPEPIAASRIHDFLLECLQHHEACTLVGFNSNAFDLGFLRGLFIRYGLNPYFFGRLTNLDVLHFCQQIAFRQPHDFPWQLTEKPDGSWYYTFTLQSLAKAFGILEGVQSHEADEDVLLTIALVQKLTASTGFTLATFRPFSLPLGLPKKPVLLRQKALDYPQKGQQPEKIVYRYYVRLFSSGKDLILVDLGRYVQDPLEPFACLRYINPNKQCFIAEPLTDSENTQWAPVFNKVLGDPVFLTMTRETYFERIKKPRDIELQIHELGFSRIDQLRESIDGLKQNPETYPTILNNLMASSTSSKDMALVQLFNRAYLNIHPHPPLAHLHRYLLPRYVTGTMLANPIDFVPLKKTVEGLEEHLAAATDPEEMALLQTIKRFTYDFIKKFQLPLD